jgi:hypothetical protein
MVWILPEHKAYSDGPFPQYRYITTNIDYNNIASLIINVLPWA